MMFEEYDSARVSVKREIQEGGRNHAFATVLSHYVSILLSMLKREVLHHSFTRATATLETVAMAMDESPDVVRTVGVAMLSHDPDDANITYGGKLQMLKDTCSRYPKHGVSLLLEQVLLITNHGDLQEAYSTLQRQLPNEPYKSNALVNGSSAVLQYLIWRKELWSVGVAEEEGVWSEELSLRVEEGGERLKAVSDTALEHFKTLYDLSPPPSYSMDSFVKVHSRLLIELGRKDEALQLLISYRDSAPHRVSACRLVCDHVRRHHRPPLLLPHLHQLAAVDESSAEALELAHMLWEVCVDDGDYEGVFGLVMGFLEYPHNRGVSTAWTLLHKVKTVWPHYEETDLWTQYTSLWDGVRAVSRE